MTQNQIQLVQESWNHVSSLDPVAVGAIFYDRLFALDPALRRLFRSPIPEQSRKLMLMIGVVVRELHRLDLLIEDVRQLGIRHLQYGVQPADYETVGSALLRTLEEGLGAGWSPELREAWSTAYTLLASAMQEEKETVAA